MSDYRISVYNEQDKAGLLKHVVVREVECRQIITIVINGEDLPKKNELIDILKSNFKEFSL